MIKKYTTKDDLMLESTVVVVKICVGRFCHCSKAIPSTELHFTGD